MIERKTPFVPLLGVFLNKPLPPLPSEHAATSADIATLKKIDQNLEQLPGLAFSLEALEALAQELTTTTVPPAVGREFASATYKIKLSENNKLLLQPTGNNVYVTLNQNSLSSSSPRTRTSNEKRVKFVEKQPLQSSRELNVKTISITGTEEIKCVANPESLSPTNATSSNSLAPLHKVPSPCSSRTTLENIEGPNMLSTFKAHHKQSSINDDVLSIRSQNSSMDNLHEPKHDSIIHRLFFYASHSSDEETDSEKRRHKSFRSKKPFTADEKTEGGFLSRIFHLDDNKSKISPSTSGSISKTTDSSSVDSLNKVQVRIETSGSSRDSQVEQQHHENVVTRFIRNYSAKDQHLNSDKETKIPNSPNDPGRSPVLVASSPPISPNLSPITLTSPQSLGYEEQEDFASGHHRHDSFLYRLFHPYHDEGHVRPQERPISPESSSEGRVSSPTSNESLERNTSSALFRRKRAATSPVGSTSPTQAISPSVSHDRLKHSHSTETLSEKYGHPQEKLGQGAQAEVRLAHVKTTIDGLTQEKLYAIKTFKKRGDHGNIKEYTKKVIAEFCINNSLRNENIVTAVDLIKDERGHWCEVLEYMPGGDLYSRIRDSSLTDVDEINCFFKQLVNAVTFMHTMGVAHRDLKPENLLLDLEHRNLKISDFGSAEVFRTMFEKTSRKCKGLCGSEPYMSPEEWDGINEYDASKVDIWSCGIVYYAMMFQTIPWRVAKKSDLHYGQYLKTRKSGMHPLDRLPPGARNLMYKILEPKPEKRLSALEIQEDPWFKSIDVCSLSDEDGKAKHVHHSRASKPNN